MTTILPPPTIEDWSGPYPPNALEDGSVYFADIVGGAVTLTISDLAPGHTLDVAIDVALSFFGSGETVASIGTTPITGLADKQRQTIRATVIVDHTLRCTFSGFADLTVFGVTLTDHTNVPDQPTPGHVLAMLAWLPIPGLNGFRLGASRLGVGALTPGASPDSVFTLGSSILGTAPLWAATTFQWRDLLPPANAVETTRGVASDGPVLSCQVGILTARAQGVWDPRVSSIRRGTEIHLIHWPTRQRIFTGGIADVQINRDKNPHKDTYQVTLTAADTVAVLAGITRYGAKNEDDDGYEIWEMRAHRLMESAPGLDYSVGGPSSGEIMCPTVWETNLAKHLDAICTSVGGVWCVNTAGVPRIRGGMPTGTPTLTFTDTQITDLAHDVWSYTDIDTRWKATDMVGAVEATTHEASIGDDGQWQADDETTTETTTSTVTLWGGSSVSVDVTVPLTELPRVARRLLRRVPEAPPPASLTLAPAHPQGPAHRGDHMARAAALDTLQPVIVTNRGETTEELTTTIHHTITPKAWTTTLGLTDRSNR